MKKYALLSLLLVTYTNHPMDRGNSQLSNAPRAYSPNSRRTFDEGIFYAIADGQEETKVLQAKLVQLEAKQELTDDFTIEELAALNLADEKLATHFTQAHMSIEDLQKKVEALAAAQLKNEEESKAQKARHAIERQASEDQTRMFKWAVGSALTVAGVSVAGALYLYYKNAALSTDITKMQKDLNALDHNYQILAATLKGAADLALESNTNITKIKEHMRNSSATIQKPADTAIAAAPITPTSSLTTDSKSGDHEERLKKLETTVYDKKTGLVAWINYLDKRLTTVETAINAPGTGLKNLIAEMKPHLKELERWENYVVDTGHNHHGKHLHVKPKTK